MTGTIINTVTVLVGGSLGTVVGTRFPAGIRSLSFQTIGLITIVLGLQRALTTTNILILLVSVVLGGILGELLHLEDGLEALGKLAQKHLGTPPLPNPPPRGGRGQNDALSTQQSPTEPPLPNPPPRGGRGQNDALSTQQSPTEPPLPNPPPRGGRGQGEDSALTTQRSISQGFVTASLIFCVGPMTILGSLEDGLSGAYQTLVLKATLDGVTSAILASTLGWGVLLAAGTVLFFQGALTLSAGLLHGLLTDSMVTEMTAAGGLMILGIGLNILELTRIRVGNLLPGLALAPALVALSRS